MKLKKEIIKNLINMGKLKIADVLFLESQGMEILIEDGLVIDIIDHEILK